MKFALIGPGQLGRQIFRAAAGERLVVGRRPLNPDEYQWDAELGYTTRMEDAAQCQIAAVAVSADACQAAFDALCPVMGEGSILLNFSTKWDIPDALRQKYPQLILLEAKLLGSAVGLSRGLNGLVILSAQDEALTAKVKSALPGLNVGSGDWRSVSSINKQATKAALAAGIALEKELQAQGYTQDMIGAAVGCLMPGALISYQANTLGHFAREIADRLKNGEI